MSSPTVLAFHHNILCVSSIESRCPLIISIRFHWPFWITVLVSFEFCERSSPSHCCLRVAFTRPQTQTGYWQKIQTVFKVSSVSHFHAHSLWNCRPKKRTSWLPLDQVKRSRTFILVLLCRVWTASVRPRVRKSVNHTHTHTGLFICFFLLLSLTSILPFNHWTTCDIKSVSFYFSAMFVLEGISRILSHKLFCQSSNLLISLIDWWR